MSKLEGALATLALLIVGVVVVGGFWIVKNLDTICGVVK